MAMAMQQQSMFRQPAQKQYGQTTATGGTAVASGYGGGAPMASSAGRGIQMPGSPGAAPSMGQQAQRYAAPSGYSGGGGYSQSASPSMYGGNMQTAPYQPQMTQQRQPMGMMAQQGMGGFQGLAQMMQQRQPMAAPMGQQSYGGGYGALAQQMQGQFEPPPGFGGGFQQPAYPGNYQAPPPRGVPMSMSPMGPPSMGGQWRPY